MIHALAMAAVTVALAALSPPSSVTAQLPSLQPVARFTDFPAAIRDGHFTVDGTKADGWAMAEPGGAFSATDVPVPNAPGRRLIFGACDPTLCLIHYERGGIAHFYELLALQQKDGQWRAIWNARGASPFANLDALRAFLEHPTGEGHWDQQWVKGDF